MNMISLTRHGDDAHRAHRRARVARAYGQFCDQFGDALLDAGLDVANENRRDDEQIARPRRHQRFAVEMVAKDRLVVVSGEASGAPASPP